MDEVKEMTTETLNLLIMTEDLKRDIRKSMMRGEESILRGITMFETMVKAMNPEKIDDEQIEFIESNVRRHLRNREETLQKINPSMHYGVNRCFLILENNYRTKKIEEKKKKTRKS